MHLGACFSISNTAAGRLKRVKSCSCDISDSALIVLESTEKILNYTITNVLHAIRALFINREGMWFYFLCRRLYSKQRKRKSSSFLKKSPRRLPGGKKKEWDFIKPAIRPHFRRRLRPVLLPRRQRKLPVVPGRSAVTQSCIYRRRNRDPALHRY